MEENNPCMMETIDSKLDRICYEIKHFDTDINIYDRVGYAAYILYSVANIFRDYFPIDYEEWMDIINEFVKMSWFVGYEVGFDIVNYDMLLYPFGEDYFNNEIPVHIWKKLQYKANEMLNSNEYEYYTNEERTHLKSIVEGHVPFGLSLEEFD